MDPAYFFEGRGPHFDNRGRLFLFLDFDGTLVPIQDNPAHCVLSEEMRSLLRRVASSRRALVAIVSGRTLKDLMKRVAIEGVYYSGSHGLEVVGPGVRYIHPQAAQTRPIMNRLCRLIEEEVDSIEGVIVEKKKFGFSLHYRLVRPEYRDFVKNSFRRVVNESSYHDRLLVLRGKMVLEVAPRVWWNKGKAVLFLLERQKDGPCPLYIGDDATDETAFKALGCQGITVRVGKSRTSAARYYVKGQREVYALLQRIAYFTGVEDQHHGQ